MRKIFVVLTLLSIFFMGYYAKVFSIDEPKSILEFKFSNDDALHAAIKFLTDFDSNLPNKVIQNYDLKNPFFSSAYRKGPDGINKKIVLVSFEDIVKKNGRAFTYLIENKGKFDYLSVGFTIRTKRNLIDDLKTFDFWSE